MCLPACCCYSSLTAPIPFSDVADEAPVKKPKSKSKTKVKTTVKQYVLPSYADRLTNCCP
jgi:hypothetical protein